MSKKDSSGKGQKSLPCSLSLPPSVRNDLSEVAAHLGVSNSALVSCLLRSELESMLRFIDAQPEVLDAIEGMCSGASGMRLRGFAGESVSLKVRLLRKFAVESVQR